MILDKIFSKNTEKNGDSTMKSIVKTISWRLLGTIDTMLIAFFITGRVELAVSIGSIEVVTKMVLYYFHERIWNKINLAYGKGKAG
jgi:uncharacterized membrane protein